MLVNGCKKSFSMLSKLILPSFLRVTRWTNGSFQLIRLTTTFYLFSSERVCNRLGIMVNGQFACLGAIQHLKSKFGEGYTVDVKVHHVTNDPNNSPMQTIHAFLTSQPNFTVEVRELSFLTGSFQVKQGTPADLFELLEQHKGPLNIETYTISQTTLEQIFLSIGKHVLQS